MAKTLQLAGAPAERLVGFAAAEPGPERATLASANAAPIHLGAGVTHPTLSLAQPRGGFGFGAARPVSAEDRVYLNVENITGVGTTGDYDIYIAARVGAGIRIVP